MPSGASESRRGDRRHKPKRIGALLALVAGLFLTAIVATPLALAANNQATGDVAGDSNALGDSNVFVLNSTGSQMPLTKRAFLPDGTAVADLSTVPAGSVVKFLLYINNHSSVEIRDVSIQDVLDADFLYSSPSIQVDNSVVECAAVACNATEEGTVFTAVNLAPTLTDGEDGDVASYTAVGTTLDLGRAVKSNGQVNLAADSVWAALVTVTMPTAAASVVNQSTGGIGALNNGTLNHGDGSGEAQRTLSATQLDLIKQARDLAGVVLAPGADVTPGQDIYFVLFVDNTTGFLAEDVRITDLLDQSEFTYVAGSLAHKSVPTGSDDLTIWTSGTWTVLTDNVGGPDDLASATDTGAPPGEDRITIGAVPAQQNLTLDIPASTLKAFRFRVTVN